MTNSYDLAILGGGPAGAAAAVYAGRKQLKTVIIAEEFGGQSTVSPDIQNWLGTVSLSGDELATSFKTHVEAVADGFIETAEGKRVSALSGDAGNFTVTLESGETYEARAILVTTGGRRRKLPVSGADQFEHKGLTYCASCDGPLFSGKDVVVIGGGNAGFESAAQLLAYTKSVTLLQRSDRYKADEITVKKVLSHPNMTGILNAEPTEVKGDTFVKGLVYKDTKTGETHELAVEGVFVEIGFLPNTEFLGNLVKLDEIKRIVIDPRTQRTSLDGVWAAGDCTDVLYHQNNIAAGDGVRALEDIYLWLRAK